VCAGCGRWIKFLPAEWTLDRARDFRLDFGKYRGRTIGEVASTPAGRDYLRWVVRNLRGGPAKAAEHVLAATVEPGHEGTMEGRRPG
jgi:hypothetical protein